MKKKFKDTKFAKIAGSILKGAIADSSLPFVGIATGAVTGLKEGLKEVKRKNLQDVVGGEGKPNYLRWASFAVFLGLILLFVFGVIDKQTFSYIWELFSKQI